MSNLVERLEDDVLSMQATLQTGTRLEGFLLGGIMQRHQQAANEITRLMADTVDRVAEMGALAAEVRSLRAENETIRGDWRDVSKEVLDLTAERDRALGALHLGGHLRPDGTVCDYSAAIVCNKCGGSGPHSEAYIERDRLREALEGFLDCWACTDNDGNVLCDHCGYRAKDCHAGHEADCPITIARAALHRGEA